MTSPTTAEVDKSTAGNFKPTDDSFKKPKLVIGHMYHIKGMYRGSFFKLLDYGTIYATLGFPKRHTNRTISCKISDLRGLR